MLVYCISFSIRLFVPFPLHFAIYTQCCRDDYDDDEDDIEQKLKELAVGESDDEAPPPPVKSKSKKKAKPATPAISAFTMLGDDSDSDKMEDDVNSVSET